MNGRIQKKIRMTLNGHHTLSNEVGVDLGSEKNLQFKKGHALCLVFYFSTAKKESRLI